jgi:hypothetical protein
MRDDKALRAFVKTVPIGKTMIDLDRPYQEELFHKVSYLGRMLAETLENCRLRLNYLDRNHDELIRQAAYMYYGQRV